MNPDIITTIIISFLIGHLIGIIVGLLIARILVVRFFDELLRRKEDE